MSLKYLTVEHVRLKHLIRIFSKIEIRSDLVHNDTPCWIWCGDRHRYSGYGQIRYRKRLEQFHRFIYAWLVEPLPRKKRKEGQQLQLDHLCRRPTCCNPLHLELVTSRVNILRGNAPAAINARRVYCVKGLHVLEGNNLTIDRAGKRRCVPCRNAHLRTSDLVKANKHRYYQKHRVAILAKMALQRREQLAE